MAAHHPTPAALDSLEADFALLDDWEDRYRYIIELGRTLEPLDPGLRVPETKVQGCAAQVWIAARPDRLRSEPRLWFVGDSDALIVKGLIAIIFMLFSGQTARAILGTDAEAALAGLGLKEHLTPQRSNGLVAMVARIKADARRALAAPALTG